MKRKSWLIRLVSIIIFLIIWNSLVYFNVTTPMYFNNIPSPIDLFTVWKEEFFNVVYYEHIFISFYRVTLGITIAILIGFPLAVLAGTNSNIYYILTTIIEIFRPIPLLAYIPIVAILSHSIEISIIFITFLGAFFPIFINVVESFERIPRKYLRIIDANNGSLLLKYTLLYIPYIIPSLYVGILVGIAASWMGVITAETLSGMHGIGYYTWNSYQIFQYEKVLIGMFTVGLLGYFSSFLLKIVRKIFLKNYFRVI